MGRQHRPRSSDPAPERAPKARARPRARRWRPRSLATAAKRFALLAALALAGCPPRAPPPDLSLDPARLLAQVRAAQDRVASVRGEVKVRVETRRGSGTVSGFAAAKKPDRVLVHTFDFFGNTASALSAAGGELSLYDARERVVYRGAATPENLARLVPIPLSPAELATLLCGSAPLLDGEPVRADPGRGFVELEIAAGQARQVLRIGPGAVVLSSSLSLPGGGPGSYDVALGERDLREGSRFPSEVTVSAREPRAKVQLTWTEAEPGAALEDTLFAPTVPRGARVVDLAETPSPAGLFPEARPPGP
jgi:outer membrane lipoprotein-sorting protein